MAPFLCGQLDSPPLSPTEVHSNPLLDDTHNILAQPSDSVITDSPSHIMANTSCQTPVPISSDSTPTSSLQDDMKADYPEEKSQTETQELLNFKQLKKRLAVEKKREAAVEAQLFELRRIEHLRNITRNPDLDPGLRHMAATMRDIVRYWVQSAQMCDEQPLLHAISFGERKGERLTAQLGQVFALFPQHWQSWLHGYQISKWGSDSWLDENLMNVLVHLHFPPELEGKTAFGLSLASSINDDINGIYKSDKCDGYLSHLIDNMIPNLPNPEDFQSEVKIFKFSANTGRIIWFWNHDGLHWVTIRSDIVNQYWTHRIYNSLEDNRTVYNWGGNIRDEVETEKTNLELIISQVSGFPTPHWYSSVRKGSTPEQENTNDCGVFTVYNTLCLLDEVPPDINVTGDRCRRLFLDSVLKGLEERLGSLPREFEDHETNINVDYMDDMSPGSSLSNPLELDNTMDVDHPSAFAEGHHRRASYSNWLGAEGERNAGVPLVSDSPDQLPSFIQSSPPGNLMITVEVAKHEEVAASVNWDIVSRGGSSPPDTVDIFTPSSLSLSSPSASLSPPVYQEAHDEVLEASYAISHSSSLSTATNSSTTDIGMVTTAGKRSSWPQATRPSKNFFAHPGPSAGELMLSASTLSSTRASLPPRTYDSMLPLFSPAPPQNICTVPPMHTASRLLSLPSSMSQVDCDLLEIFPRSPSKKLSLEEIRRRFAVLQRLKHHELLTERSLKTIMQFPIAHRLKMTTNLLDRMDDRLGASE